MWDRCMPKTYYDFFFRAVQNQQICEVLLAINILNREMDMGGGFKSPHIQTTKDQSSLFFTYLYINVVFLDGLVKSLSFK